MKYHIHISGLKDGEYTYSFDIDKQFFESLIYEESRDCKINILAVLTQRGNKLTLSIVVKGKIFDLLCDICASERIVTINRLFNYNIELSSLNTEKQDDIIYINRNQKEIEISSLIYESIILSLPNKNVHSGKVSDKCDTDMISLVKKYSKKENVKDPRWKDLDKLKDLI